MQGFATSGHSANQISKTTPPSDLISSRSLTIPSIKTRIAVAHIYQIIRWNGQKSSIPISDFTAFYFYLPQYWGLLQSIQQIYQDIFQLQVIINMLNCHANRELKLHI